MPAAGSLKEDSKFNSGAGQVVWYSIVRRIFEKGGGGRKFENNEDEK